MGTTGGLSAAAGCGGLDSLSVTLRIGGGIGDGDGIHWGQGHLETGDYMLGTFRAHVHLSHNVTGG